MRKDIIELPDCVNKLKEDMRKLVAAGASAQCGIKFSLHA